ncbi:MAG: hypothetical protein JKX76_04185, partial [Colwellia sp.]|nr:hypothetical protein [Colwellia sp.]
YRPTGDQLDLNNGVTQNQTRTTAVTTGAITNQDGTFTPVPININPGEIVSVNVVQISSAANVADRVTITQNGNPLGAGPILNVGDAVQANNISPAGGGQVMVNIVMNPANVATNVNPGGVAGGNVAAWSFVNVTITVSRTTTRAVLKLPRTKGTTGSFSSLINPDGTIQ